MRHRKCIFLLKRAIERFFVHVFAVFSATIQNIELIFWHMREKIVWKGSAGPKFEKYNFNARISQKNITSFRGVLAVEISSYRTSEI